MSNVNADLESIRVQLGQESEIFRDYSRIPRITYRNVWVMGHRVNGGNFNSRNIDLQHFEKLNRNVDTFLLWSSLYSALSCYPRKMIGRRIWKSFAGYCTARDGPDKRRKYPIPDFWTSTRCFTTVVSNFRLFLIWLAYSGFPEIYPTSSLHNM